MLPRVMARVLTALFAAGAAVLCMAATSSALPEHFDLVEVALGMQIHGVPTDLYQFSRNAPPEQVADEVRAKWHARSTEPLFEATVGGDLVISQKAGTQWQTVRLKRASFGRTAGIFASASMFVTGQSLRNPVPFALPAGTRVAQYTHNDDMSMRNDMWLLENHLSVGANVGVVKARMTALGLTQDPSIRFPGSPEKAWAGAFSTQSERWTVTVQRLDAGTFVVVNRVRKG